MDGWTKEDVAFAALVTCVCMVMITMCMVMIVAMLPTTRHSQTIELKAEK